jgi:hypothetical protein
MLIQWKHVDELLEKSRGVAIVQIKLAEYFDRFSWSQAELSCQADVSPQWVLRTRRREDREVQCREDRRGPGSKFQAQEAKAISQWAVSRASRSRNCCAKNALKSASEAAILSNGARICRYLPGNLSTPKIQSNSIVEEKLRPTRKPPGSCLILRRE